MGVSFPETKIIVKLFNRLKLSQGSVPLAQSEDSSVNLVVVFIRDHVQSMDPTVQLSHTWMENYYYSHYEHFPNLSLHVKLSITPPIQKHPHLRHKIEIRIITKKG